MKLKIGQTILVGLAFFSICIFWETYDALMPLFLANFHLNKTIIGTIMALDNILALVLLPFMGLLSDRTHTKLGRRIPFIVVGAVLAACTLLLLNFAHNAHLLWLVISVTCFLLIFMCLYRTPAVSLMPDVTPKPLRSKANAIINIMGLVGGVTFLLLSMAFVKYEGEGESRVLLTGNWALICIVAGFMVAAAVVMLFTVKENALVAKREQTEIEHGYTEEHDDTPQEKKNFFKGLAESFRSLDKAEKKSYFFLMLSVFLWFFGYNAAKTWMSTFAKDALGGDFSTPLLVANIVGFACYIPSGILGGKIGRRNTVMLGLGLVALGFLLAVVFIVAGIKGSTLVALFYVVFGLVGAGWATLNVHSYVMSVEFAKKGNTGFFTGNYYTFSMGAQALTPVVSGALYQALGANIIFVYSLFFVGISIITMLFVKHGNVKPQEDKTILERLDVD